MAVPSDPSGGEPVGRGDHAFPEVSTPPVWLVAGMSAAAGLVHAAAAGSHNAVAQLALLFAVAALVQVGWAGVVALRPSRSLLVVGAILNGGMVACWALTRIIGIAGIQGLGTKQEIGLPDAMAALFAAGSAIGAGVLAVRGWRANPRPLRARDQAPAYALLACVALVLALPAMVAPHDHEHTTASTDAAAVHAHAGDGVEVAATDGGEAAPDGHVHSPDGSAPTGPTDASRPTATEQARADKLVKDTKAALAKYTTTGSVEAAGYYSIGDALTGYEHFVNTAYLDDGDELDPGRIESIVFKVDGDTKQLVTGMYILTSGKTMADVPDVGGPLTVWHDHQNLCWDASGHVVGVKVGDVCTRGTFHATAPMLHVWVVPNECGPFSGVEGTVVAAAHGTSCAHTHDAPGTTGSASGTSATPDPPS